MKTDYQQMEEGGDDNIQKNTGMTLNFNPINKKQNLLENISNISALMKSRIKAEISPNDFIKKFKWIIIYMIVILIIIIIFMQYHIILGLINLCLGVLGFVFLIHGILKRMVGTYRMGTAFWILELLAIAFEIVINIIITFGKIFSGENSFFVGLIKFVGVTILMAVFLIICAFFTYQMMKNKNLFNNNYTNNNNQTKSGIHFANPIQTPGTVALNNN